MPDRKRLPARSKLTKRADLLRNAVRKNDGKRDRGGIGTPSTMERPKGDLSKFTKKPTSRSVLPLSEKERPRVASGQTSSLIPAILLICVVRTSPH